MIKDWYFFLQKGRADGPHTPQEMFKAIETGRLGPHDLIYKDGAEKWLPGHQFAEFRNLFKMTIKAEIDEGWVILTKIKTEKGVNYLQKGPFPTSKVRELLKGGYIQYRDFIWREGQLKWQRISSVEIFNPPPVQWQAKNKLPQDVSEKDINSTTASEILYNTQDSVKVDAPKEALSGEVFEISTAEPAPEVVRKTPQTPGQADPIQNRRNQERRAVQDRRAKGPAKLKKTQPFLPITLLVLAIGIGVAGYIHRGEIVKLFSKPKPKVEKAIVKEIPRPVVPVVAPPAAPVVPPTPTFPRVVATRLAILVGGTDSAPVIRFATDASHHFGIEVKVIGAAGEILDRVSVYRELTVRRKPEEAYILNLKSMELGEGPYRIDAEIESFKARQTVRVGRKDAEFLRNLSRHRKVISLPYQRERRRLIRAAGALMRLADGLKSGSMPVAKWRQEMGQFRQERFDGVNLSKPQSLVFPELWQQLGMSHSLLQIAAGDLALIDQRRLEIKKLQQKTAQLSLFD